ncbi:uncharacterized protein LAESUDRAFT_667125, partial [Laetiporus sulphureus 93-53]
CEKNDFDSKLSSDIATHKAKILESQISQGILEGHIQVSQPAEHAISYSDEAFKSAAIQWLVETDQPIGAFEHQAFTNLINLTSHAKGVAKISKRASTRREIVDLFHQCLCDLKKWLQICLSESSSS